MFCYRNLKMKTLLSITLFFVFTSFIIPAPVMAQKDPFADAGFIQARIQMAAPDFTLKDLGQNDVNLSDYRGKTVLLFFWTTW